MYRCFGSVFTSALSALAVLAITVPPSAAVDPGLLALVMPEAQTLAGMEVNRALITPFGRFMLSRMPQNEDVDRFVAATGFDYRRDLKEILIASPNPSGLNARGDVLLLLRGTFDVSKMSALAALTGSVTETVEGIQLMTPPGPALSSSLAFLNPSTLVVGPTDAVKAVISRTASPATGTPPAGTLVSRALAIAGGNEVWFASVTPLSKLMEGQQTPFPSAAFSTILEYSAGLHLDDDGITLSTEVLTRSDRDAQALSDVLKFVSSMIKNPQAAPLQNAKFTQDGATVRMSVSITESEAEKLIGGAGNVRRVTFPGR
jgi:hypothetical protein